MGSKRKAWGEAVQGAFLDSLAASAHVSRSAQAAGVPLSTVYYQRRRNADFRAAWQAALAQGFEMLETHLLALAISGETSVPTGLEGAAATIEREAALKLLGVHRARQAGKGAGDTGAPRRRLSPEEIEAALTARIDAVVNRRGTGA